jgi:hypothetical protein
MLGVDGGREPQNGPAFLPDFPSFRPPARAPRYENGKEPVMAVT